MFFSLYLVLLYLYHYIILFLSFPPSFFISFSIPYYLFFYLILFFYFFFYSVSISFVFSLSSLTLSVYLSISHSLHLLLTWSIDIHSYKNVQYNEHTRYLQTVASPNGCSDCSRCWQQSVLDCYEVCIICIILYTPLRMITSNVRILYKSMWLLMQSYRPSLNIFLYTE